MLLGTSCQNEEIVSRTEGQEFSLTLDMGAKSRTMMGENGAVWGDNEALYVVGDGGKSYGTLTMVWKSEDGKSAMFSGKITGDVSDLEHMVYPVPNEDNQIPMFTLDGANHNAPMVGSIEGGEVTDLGYVGGLVKVKVNGEVGQNGVTLKAVEGSNANTGTSVVAGYYQFNPTSGTLEYKQYEVGEGENNTVTVTNIPENGIIYLPVDTDATKDNAETITVSLIIENEEPVVAQVKVAENGATESGENSFPVVNYDEGVGVVSSKVGTLDELKNALSIGGEYELTNNIETSEILQIGKNVEIKGNEYKITSSANRVFRITASKVNVVMNKVNMVSTAVREGTNDIRGISIDGNLEGIGLALDTCSVDFTDASAHDWSYAVNVSGNTNHCGITINGGEYEGANVINIWGDSHGIHIENATLTSLYQPNEFYCGACIRIEGIIEYLETFKNTFEGVNAKHISVADGKYIRRSTGSDDVINAAPVIAKVGEEWCYSLEEAATKRGDIYLFSDVKLNNDITLTANLVIPNGEKIDFDMNGKKIVIDGSSADQVIDFKNEGELTIRNGIILAENFENSRRCIYNYGTMTIDSLEFTQTYHDKGAAINNEGQMTIEFARVNAEAYAIWNSGDNSSVTVKDGLFVNNAHLLPGNNSANYCVRNTNGATMTVNGGTFQGTHGALACDGGATAVLNAGIYECIGLTNVSDHVLYTDNDSSITFDAKTCKIMFGVGFEDANDTKLYGNCQEK